MIHANDFELKEAVLKNDARTLRLICTKNIFKIIKKLRIFVIRYSCHPDVTPNQSLLVLFVVRYCPIRHETCVLSKLSVPNLSS